MYRYYMFHKPFGCVTARRDDRHPTVMDWFRDLGNENLSPVGRLTGRPKGSSSSPTTVCGTGR